jgi:hypothetical protein
MRYMIKGAGYLPRPTPQQERLTALYGPGKGLEEEI